MNIKSNTIWHQDHLPPNPTDFYSATFEAIIKLYFRNSQTQQI